MMIRTDRRRFPILIAAIAALAMAMALLFSPVQAQEGSAPDKPQGPTVRPPACPPLASRPPGPCRRQRTRRTSTIRTVGTTQYSPINGWPTIRTSPARLTTPARCWTHTRASPSG